jgi:hypothetical protein
MTLAEMLEKAVSVEVVVENDEGGHTRYYIAQDQLDLARVAIASQRQPVLDWKLSNEAKAQIAAINENIRNALISADRIIAGASAVPNGDRQ